MWWSAERPSHLVEASPTFTPRKRGLFSHLFEAAEQNNRVFRLFSSHGQQNFE
jgi:hypothetical protein